MRRSEHGLHLFFGPAAISAGQSRQGLSRLAIPARLQKLSLLSLIAGMLQIVIPPAGAGRAAQLIAIGGDCLRAIQADPHALAAIMKIVRAFAWHERRSITGGR